MVFSTLTASDIADALATSLDAGQTLDFSNRNLVDVGEVGAEELAKIGREVDLAEDSPLQRYALARIPGYPGLISRFLRRLALASNRLATLPMAFSLLSHLRYLNLRSNSFSAFPEVVRTQPGLD